MTTKVATKRVNNIINKSDEAMIRSCDGIIARAEKRDAEHREEYNATTGEFDEIVTPERFVISYHHGMMPAYDEQSYATVAELAAAMAKFADLRTWRVRKDD